jgi:hypothetical protein
MCGALTWVSIGAAIHLFITRVANLTLVALCEKGFICLSVTLFNRG